MNAIVITEEYWRNSPLSVVRFIGTIKIESSTFIIVNKDGRDIFELSAKAEKEGREKAIEPGEPVDLCRVEFVPIYRKLGRERFFQFIKDNQDVNTVELAKKRLKEWQKKQNV